MLSLGSLHASLHHTRATGKSALNEFYRIAFRKKLYTSIKELQDDLDEWIRSYNEERPHQGRWCFGKTPTQTFLDAIPIFLSIVRQMRIK